LIYLKKLNKKLLAEATFSIIFQR